MADFDLVPAKTQIAPTSSTKFGGVHLPINVAITTAMLALNKTTRILRLPKGFIVTGIALIVPDMDSNGAPALVFDIGDATTSGRLISGSTAGQAGGTITTANLVTAGMLYEFPANTDLLFKATTAAATAAAGTLKGVLSGYLR